MIIKEYHRGTDRLMVFLGDRGWKRGRCRYSGAPIMLPRYRFAFHAFWRQDYLEIYVRLPNDWFWEKRWGKQ